MVIGALGAEPELALHDGEQLVYRVAWGIFGNAGEIKIQAARERRALTACLTGDNILLYACELRRHASV